MLYALGCLLFFNYYIKVLNFFILYFLFIKNIFLKLIIIFLFFYLIVFFLKKNKVSSYFLFFLKILNFSKKLKLSFFYFLKNLYKYFYLFLYLFQVKLKTITLISNTLFESLTVWKPLFRKISYFGFYQASSIKWALKNINSK